MPEKFEMPKDPEGVELAKHIRSGLEQLGVDAKDAPYVKLLQALEIGGRTTLQNYFWSQLDKFRQLPDEVVALFERVVFDAGESRMENETPWNQSQFREAKKK